MANFAVCFEKLRAQDATGCCRFSPIDRRMPTDGCMRLALRDSRDGDFSWKYGEMDSKIKISTLPTRIWEYEIRCWTGSWCMSHCRSLPGILSLGRQPPSLVSIFEIVNRQIETYVGTELRSLKIKIYVRKILMWKQMPFLYAFWEWTFSILVFLSARIKRNNYVKGYNFRVSSQRYALHKE